MKTEDRIKVAEAMNNKDIKALIKRLNEWAAAEKTYLGHKLDCLDAARTLKAIVDSGVLKDE